MNKEKLREKIEHYFPRFILGYVFGILGFIYGVFRNPRGVNLATIEKAKKSSKCNLLATGPSISNADIDKLTGEDCYTVSNFFLHEKIHELNPIGHFVAAYHRPLCLENFKNWLKLMDSKLPKGTILITDSRNREILESIQLNQSRMIIYLDTFPKYEIFSIRKLGAQIRPGTVPIMALPILYLAGYREINLYGCDHNTLQYYREPVENFYNTNADVRKGATDKESWNGYNIIKALDENIYLFKQYKLLDEYFKKNGILLRNRSLNSWLDFIQK